MLEHFLLESNLVVSDARPRMYNCGGSESSKINNAVRISHGLQKQDINVLLILLLLLLLLS